MFRITPIDDPDADFEIKESSLAYKKFWKPLYGRQFIPKFIVDQYYRHYSDPSLVRCGNFIISNNDWHGPQGPGEHSSDSTVQRWIAWYIPNSIRNLFSKDENNNVIKKKLSLSSNFDYRLDNSSSTIPFVLEDNEPIFTVRDLDFKNLDELYRLRDIAYKIMAKHGNTDRDKINMYFHYPVRSPLALIHLHIAVGHRETGSLAKRSHNLKDVIAHIEANGDYSSHSLFEFYTLKKGRDGSLDEIMAYKGQKSSLEDKLDVIIPCSENDMSLIESSFSSLMKSTNQINKAFVISKKDPKIDGVKWINQESFPFNIQDLGSRWRFQQCLKLYAPYIIPNILNYVLLADADVIWHCKNLKFIDQEGRTLFVKSFNQKDIEGYENFRLDVINELCGYIKYNYSAITHHAVIDRRILSNIFASCRRVFGNELQDIFSKGKPSEWELYHSYARRTSPNLQSHRALKFEVTGDRQTAIDGRIGVDYFVCHHHRRLGYVDTHEDGNYIYDKIRNQKK